MDLRGFSTRMAVLGQTIETNASKLKRKVAVQVDGAVVLATPVDTGRARANWQVELNNVPDGTLPEPNSAAEGTRAALDNAKSTIARAQPGDTIVIVNNLPYIQRLNDGWSAQAPANYVEKAVLVGAQAVKGAKLTITNGVK